MVSLSSILDSNADVTALTPSASSNSSSSNSFAQQLATALEGYLNQASSGSSLNIQVSQVAGQNAGNSQFLVTVTPGSTPTATAAKTASVPTPAASTASGSTTPAASTGTMEQLFSGYQAPVAASSTSSSSSTTPVTETEADAYWAAQPAAVQVLRNMPDSDAKDALALNLANQGYSIDNEIMVQGWDPLLTMTARQGEGYSYVPSYGQAPILVAPGVSDPGVTNTYNPGNPPPGSISVSTAFAAGTIESPLVQMLEAQAATS